MMAPTEQQVAPYRLAYQNAPIRCVLVPEALLPSAVSAARQRLAAQARWRTRDLAHCGHYSYVDDVCDPELFAPLLQLARLVSGAPHTVARARLCRLIRGDYALQGDDPVREGVELTCDLSAASGDAAQTVYRHRGANFFVVPQRSASVALVERTNTVTRYDRYLNHRVGDAIVYRLRLLLRSASVATPTV